MMVRWIFGGMFFLAIVFLLPRAGAADPYEAFSVSRVQAKPAADFSLPSVDTRKVSLSDYRGKVVLLGFFQTF
jgi:cytochrome oxidase Cu insertion factor (SCO1/SenC/PrrC family)